MKKSVVLIRSMLLLCSLLLCSTAHADTQAQIDKVVKRLSDIAVVQGSFNQQKKLQGLAYSLNAQGTFIFWRTHGLYIATEKPFFNAMTITGSDIITWQPNGTGSVAAEQSGLIQREINKTLLAFFSADIALIQQRFIADWVFEQDKWQLTLTPRLELIKKNMRTAVMNGDQFLQKLVVTAANGDETTIEFNAQVESALPTSAQCRWFYVQAQEACTTFPQLLNSHNTLIFYPECAVTHDNNNKNFTGTLAAIIQMDICIGVHGDAAAGFSSA